MKKTILASSAILLFFGNYVAQENEANENVAEVEFIKNIKFATTPPLRDLAQEYMHLTEADLFSKHADTNGPSKRPRPEVVNQNALPNGADPVAQLTMGTRASGQTLVNFNGLGGGFPPDPSGAAGLDHYVQAVNTAYRVWNKDGTPVSGQPPSGFPLNNLWPGAANDGDPIVMYDKHADRWVITQFQTSGNKILFAISQTTDPLGSYYTYEYTFSQFPDYPKYSIWSDGYYMTANTWTQNVAVFDREKMLDGDPDAGVIKLNFPSGVAYQFRSVLPADADGTLPPYGTPNYLFHIQDDSWQGVSFDHIKVFKFQTDWDTPSNSTVTISQSIPTEPFNANFTQSWNDIPQPGTTQRIDAIATVLNYRAQYMRWTGYNTVMLCHVVDVNNASGIASKRAGVRWYELRQYGEDAEWEIYQQGTYAPGNEHRWLASIAMDKYGDIAMAYSIGSSTMYPSLAFTGRYSWGAPGEMTQAEFMAVEGTGSQTGGNRYGDYAHMSLDPADQSIFWYTGEYLGSNGARRTRIFSFRIGNLVDVAEHIIDQLDWQIKTLDGSFDVLVTGLPEGEQVQLDLFDAMGRLIETNQFTATSGQVARVFNVANLATGTYMIRIGNEGFQDVKKVIKK
jgi:hypothetical protein